MATDLEFQIQLALGHAPHSIKPLSGGSVAEVFQISMPDGDQFVGKLGQSSGALLSEGWMLEYLRNNSSLPVPKVFYSSDQLLIMEYLHNEGGISDSAQKHAADLLAALHDITSSNYGLNKDTVIGGLHQPNNTSKQWITFFRDQRLIYMGRQSLEVGKLPSNLMKKLELFCERLDEFIEEPSYPGLIHGDMWGGNILCDRTGVIGFIDPAIYFADPEIELAFSTLFGTFGKTFFDRYAEHRKIKPDFFEIRKDIYNLYPLLVHVRLFGGSYVNSVNKILSKFIN